MKALLLILMIASGNASSIDLILGGVSRHLDGKTYLDGEVNKKYNSNHKIKGVGFNHGEYYVSLINFDNSYYIDSYSVSVGKKYGPVYIGLSIADNYEKSGYYHYKGYLLAPSIKYDYGYFRLMGFATAVIGSFVFNIPL